MTKTGRVVATADFLGRPRVQSISTEPSLTVISDAHLTDIGNILKQYGAGDGKIMAMLDETQLIYKDVSEFTDLGDALNQARIAEVEFMKLPSKVREIFDHDVAKWLDTAHDKEKRDALVEAGFIVAGKNAVQGGDAGSGKVDGAGAPSTGAGDKEETEPVEGGVKSS